MKDRPHYGTSVPVRKFVAVCLTMQLHKKSHTSTFCVKGQVLTGYISQQDRLTKFTRIHVDQTGPLIRKFLLHDSSVFVLELSML